MYKKIKIDNKIFNLVIGLSLMQGLAFLSPRMIELMDRFGYQSLRLAYGEVSSFQLDAMVVLTHGIMIVTAWIILSGRNAFVYVPVGFKKIIIMRIVGMLCIIPAFVLGGDKGYFWTIPLLYSSLFALLPTITFSRYKILYIMLLGLTFAASGSKAGVIYVIIVAYIYSPKNIKFLDIVGAIALLTFGLIITMYVRDELEVLPLLPAIIIWREYSWEMTGLALNYIKDGHQLPYSVIWESVLTLMPAMLNESKIAVTHSVPTFIAASDSAMLPDAGFYLSYIACFILDFGFLGIFIGFTLYVMLLKSAIRSLSTSKKTMQIGLPFLIFIHYLLNGELGFYISHVIFGSIILFIMSLRFDRGSNQLELTRVSQRSQFVT